ncbi:MAG: hypothetical protein AAF383_12975 [Cyanobacteria bacterium P01_A01_bin.83]
MSPKLLSFGIVAGILFPNCVLAQQVIQQSASSSATAIGNGNFAASSVNQSAAQNGSHAPGQTIIQNGESNATAIGENNVVISDLEQVSVQNQHGVGNGQRQLSIQNATNNAAAVGRNNTIINRSGQYNFQNQWSY